MRKSKARVPRAASRDLMISTILIADDDPVQRRLLEATVRRFGYAAEVVDSGEAALARLEAAGQTSIDLLILDLVMPDLDGMGVLGRMRERKIGVPVIVQTAHGSIEAVISAMRAGAHDFVVKPVGAERLQCSIKNALRADALEEEIRRINRRNSGTLGFKDLVSKSDAMARIIRLGERAARSTIPVLIEGESGVGKELVARAIQGASDRRGKAFVTVNCGALRGRRGQAHSRYQCRGAEPALVIRLAGQCAPAGERDFPRHRALRRRRTDGGGVSANRGAGRRIRRPRAAAAGAGADLVGAG